MSRFRPVYHEGLWFKDAASWKRWIILWDGVRTMIKSLSRHRVPVLLQLSAVECGAACLAMVLSYYGRQTRVADCRACCGIGRDGVTARTIAEAARQQGLHVKVYSADLADFGYVCLPAIAHWDFNHFVVVERWSSKGVTIVDPASGRRQLTAAEFGAGFTGVVLTLEPGIHFEVRRATARPSWLTYLLTSLVQVPGALAQILGASLVLQALGLTLPIVTQVLVDRILPFHITDVMPMLGVGMALLVLTQLVTGYLRAMLLIYLQGRLDTRMMLGFVEHLLALPYQFFQQRTSGDLLMRLSSNTIIREMLTGQTVSIVLDGTFVLVSLTILLLREPVLGALALGIGLLQVALLLGSTRRARDLMQRDLAAQAASQSYLVEALKGIATLKAAGGEERALDHWSDLFVAELNLSLQRSQLSAVVETAMTGLRTLAPLLLMWVGALRVLDGSMSLGAMLALNTLAASFLTPLASLALSGQRLQLARAYVDRIADVMEAEPEQDAQEIPGAPRVQGRIDVTGVSFRYDPHAPLNLRDISVRIEPGQKVALVGRTGSGKSTLAMLLLGLYAPTEGEVLYDGLPLQGMNYRTVRSQLGVVLQEPFLFAGSIRQNIAFNDPGLALDDVMAAARHAAIHDEIMRMPMGYETLVAEGGAALSGGQRQRLAIARALAHKPAILLLDEATSHLDALTERLIDERLSALSCTRIVIAHRLSTIRNADLILVLDDGAIVERGSHEHLVAQGGLYAALVASQADGDALYLMHWGRRAPNGTGSMMVDPAGRLGS